MRKPLHRQASYCRLLDRAAPQDGRDDPWLITQTPSVIRSYQALLVPFSAFCAGNAVADYEASDGLVLDYLRAVIRVGGRAPTIRRVCSAINCLRVSNRRAMLDSVELRTLLKKLIRDHEVEKATPLTWAEVCGMCDHIRAVEKPVRAARDCALLLFAWETLERPIEYADLMFEHFKPLGRREVLANGQAMYKPATLATAQNLIIKIPKSKTDQQARGQRLGIRARADKQYCAIWALAEWARLSGRTKGPVFVRIVSERAVGQRGMYTSSIRDVFAKNATALGITGKIVPYSARRGHATHLDDAGAPLPNIAEKLRHDELRSSRGYIERERVRWSSHPSRGYLR